MSSNACGIDHLPKYLYCGKLRDYDGTANDNKGQNDPSSLDSCYEIPEEAPVEERFVQNADDVPIMPKDRVTYMRKMNQSIEGAKNASFFDLSLYPQNYNTPIMYNVVKKLLAPINGSSVGPEWLVRVQLDESAPAFTALKTLVLPNNSNQLDENEVKERDVVRAFRCCVGAESSQETIMNCGVLWQGSTISQPCSFESDKNCDAVKILYCTQTKLDSDFNTCSDFVFKSLGKVVNSGGPITNVGIINGAVLTAMCKNKNQFWEKLCGCHYPVDITTIPDDAELTKIVYGSAMYKPYADYLDAYIKAYPISKDTFQLLVADPRCYYIPCSILNQNIKDIGQINVLQDCATRGINFIACNQVNNVEAGRDVNGPQNLTNTCNISVNGSDTTNNLQSRTPSTGQPPPADRPPSDSPLIGSPPSDSPLIGSPPVLNTTTPKSTTTPWPLIGIVCGIIAFIALCVFFVVGSVLKARRDAAAEAASQTNFYSI
jgi:hypothetical protein